MDDDDDGDNDDEDTARPGSLVLLFFWSNEFTYTCTNAPSICCYKTHRIIDVSRKRHNIDTPI